MMHNHSLSNSQLKSFHGIVMGWIAWCVTLIAVHAELPSLKKDPWNDCFVVYESQRYDFTMSSDASIVLIPKNRDKAHVAVKNQIRMDYGIEEMKPDGELVLKKIDESSLESSQSASDHLEQVVIRGKATGGSKFELYIEQSRGVISMGGRIVDSGKLKKYPLRFTIRVSIPNVYTGDDKGGKKSQKAFYKKMRGDCVDLKRIDGSRLKMELEDARDLGSKEVLGVGVAQADVKIGYYDGRVFQFSASQHSVIALSKGGENEPLHRGFTLHWHADESKDPEAKSRLSFYVK